MFKYCPLYVDGSKPLIEDGDVFKITVQHSVDTDNVGVNVGSHVGGEINVKTQVLEIIRNQEGVNTNGISDKLPNIVKRTIERYIKELKDDNLIEFVGTNRNGGYYIK